MLLFSSIAIAQHGSNCLQQFTLIAQPSLATYGPGTTVTFTLTITSYWQVANNWLHGVVPHFGNGWNVNTITGQVPANTCGGNGTWSWYNQTVTGLRNTDGPGFYFESDLGCTGCSRRDPGDNFGDNNLYNCTWIFSWTITTDICPNTDLSVIVYVYGDSETGSWGSYACYADIDPSFSALMQCVNCDDNDPCTRDSLITN